MVEEDNTPPPPVTACRRCRKQKLRCTRELPSCKRCSDIAYTCEYPLPPDRKLLAAKRVQEAKARARRESEISGASLQGQQRLPGDGERRDVYAPSSAFGASHGSDTIYRPKSDEKHKFRSESSTVDYQAPTPPLQALLKRTTLPSSEVAIFLIEIYFSRIFTANLLFHKRSFLSDYTANKVPDFVTLSIFALASIFLGATPEQSHQEGDEDGVDLGMSIMSIAESSKQGFEWATAASQRALLQADLPRIEMVQACLNLSMYWFSRNQLLRAHVHAYNAYMTVQLLHFNDPRIDDENNGVESCLSDELKRRCFWSCWIASCIGQDNASFKSGPWQDVIGLPLPSDEESFKSGRPIPVECCDENGNVKSLGTTHSKPEPSPSSELAKFFGLWWEIQRFVKIHQESHAADSLGRFATQLELDRRLGLTFDGLHPNLKYQSADYLIPPKVDPFMFFAIQCLYRVSACALHTSIVPLFSETPSTPRVSKKLVRISAEESVRHSGAILDMATVFLKTHPDVSRIPDFTGYAMFVACTVYFKTLLAQRKLQKHRIGRFKAAICILERLKEYWTKSQDLWDMLKKLFASKGIPLETISKSDNRVNTSSEEKDTDVDKIVSHEDTPQKGQGTDIYTYIAHNHVASPRPQSDAGSSARETPSAHKSPSPNIPGPSERIHPGHQVANDAGLQRVNSDPRTFILPHQQNLATSSSLNQFTKSAPGYHHPFTSNLHDNPQSFSTTQGGFELMGPVAEDYHMQGNTVDMTRLPHGMGQNIDGFTEAGGFEFSAMDIDGGNFWWDQSFGMAFEADPSQMDFSFDGSGGYEFHPFSYA